MTTQQRLLSLLADGRLHSGNELAAATGVTRAAVWKQIRQLEALGLEIEAQAGQGYCLASPVELLEQEKILQTLSAETRSLIAEFEVLWTAASTSDYLLQRKRVATGQASVCMAEYQSGGRGRRGRRWFAPAGQGLCLSVAWCFPSSPASLSCLGLAVGVGVLRALRACGAPDARLKWPNDIVVAGNKLAGILIDVHGEAGGPLRAVAGVGVNYALNAATRDAVVASGGLTPASLADRKLAAGAGRNMAAGRLISEVLMALRQFEHSGFESLVDEWLEADYLCGKTVAVQTDTAKIEGVACGISPDGRLQVDVNGEMHQLVTGDVSVRAVE